MHDTAMAIAQKLFSNDAESCWRIVIEVGSMDVNGSLRSVAPDNVTYLGLDTEYGKSVDIKLKIGDPFPFAIILRTAWSLPRNLNMMNSFG